MTELCKVMEHITHFGPDVPYNRADFFSEISYHPGYNRTQPGLYQFNQGLQISKKITRVMVRLWRSYGAVMVGLWSGYGYFFCKTKFRNRTIE